MHPYNTAAAAAAGIAAGGEAVSDEEDPNQQARDLVRDYQNERARGRQRSKLSMFEAVEGARVGEDLFPSYRLPNGKGTVQ